jgi:hypothetical protein
MMDTRLRIEGIKLHTDTKHMLLALGCDLVFHEWGRPNAIAQRGEPCFQVFFPHGSKNIKAPPEKKEPRRRRGEPKPPRKITYILKHGWILVPSKEHGETIVVYRPADSRTEVPGIIVAVRKAISTASTRCGYKRGKDMRELRVKKSIGTVTGQPKELMI